jgi:hypothetical protein
MTNSETAPKPVPKVSGAGQGNHAIQNELELAAWHVLRGRIIVARQHERIAQLKSLGHPTADHEQTLRVFASTLDIFEEHERALREQYVLSKTLAKR